MKRWLMGLMAALCFAASAWVLWAVAPLSWVRYGDPARDLAALEFLTGIDRSGGLLGTNAIDYLEQRAGALADSIFVLALAMALARLGWLALRRFQRGAGDATQPSRLGALLHGVAAFALALPGCLMAWMSFEYCSSWYGPEDTFMSRFDMAFVSELGALALLGLLGSAWLLSRRSRWLVPLLVLALLVLRQAWGSGAQQECLSLPGMLHGGQWVLQVQ